MMRARFREGERRTRGPISMEVFGKPNPLALSILAVRAADADYSTENPAALPAGEHLAVIVNDGVGARVLWLGTRGLIREVVSGHTLRAA